MYKILIIIVNWNGGYKVIRCIDSVYKIMKNLSFSIIVVDNNSEDGAINRIEKKYKEITIIKIEKNLGFSKANNIGLKYIFDNNIKTDYIFFLNNDTELLQGSIENLITFLDHNNNIVALTPSIIEDSGKFQTGVGGKRFNLINIFIYFFFLNKLPFMKSFGINLNQKYFYKKNKIVNLDWVSGTAFFVRFSMIKAYELFPTNYFMYFEDVVLSDNIKHNGRLVYYPFYTILHKHEYNKKSIEIYFRSFFSYLKQNGFSIFRLKLVKKIICIGLCLRYLVFKLLGRFDKNKLCMADINKSQVKVIKEIDFK